MKKLLTHAQAADYLGVNENTLYSLVYSKRIGRVKHGKMNLFDAKEIRAYKRKREQSRKERARKMAATRTKNANYGRPKGVYEIWAPGSIAENRAPRVLHRFTADDKAAAEARLAEYPPGCWLYYDGTREFNEDFKG